MGLYVQQLDPQGLTSNGSRSCISNGFGTTREAPKSSASFMTSGVLEAVIRITRLRGERAPNTREQRQIVRIRQPVIEKDRVDRLRRIRESLNRSRPVSASMTVRPACPNVSAIAHRTE